MTSEVSDCRLSSPVVITQSKMREYFLNKSFNLTFQSQYLIFSKTSEKNKFTLPFIRPPSPLGGVHSVQGVGADIYVHPVVAL